LKFNATHIASSIRKETCSGNLILTVATIDTRIRSKKLDVYLDQFRGPVSSYTEWRLYAIDEQEYASKTINKLPH